MNPDAGRKQSLLIGLLFDIILSIWARLGESRETGVSITMRRQPGCISENGE